MKVNGADIFLGAYAERQQNSYQLNQRTLSVSEEKAEAITAGIKEAFHSLSLQNRGIKVAISEEDMDFLCSEEGFQKMKQDVMDLYIKNANQQKVIAKDKNPEDLFWNNTGNQWLIFSENLYDNGFYTRMSDDDIKEFEDTLAYITSGMDRLSRSQYLIGIEFSSFQEEYKYFMSSGEAALELESSVAALRHLSGTLLPKEQQEEFDELIHMFYQHNKEVLSEYSNPMESFNKVIAGIHSKKSPYTSLLENVSEKPVGEYKYTIMLGMIEKSDLEQKQYQEELKILFDKIEKNGNNSDVWEQIKECFLEYSSGDSDDEEFRQYVFEQADYLFKHMTNCWGRLFELSSSV